MQEASTAPRNAVARPAWAHAAWFAAGLGFLALAKARHLLSGYTRPKPFGLDQTDRCIDYAVGLGAMYVAGLRRRGVELAGREVLELGPGSDLGVGLHLRDLSTVGLLALVVVLQMTTSVVSSSPRSSRS